MIVILGAGLSGLSASYHLGHQNCLLLERNAHAFGHIASEQRDGFTWDIGPHVSFTKHDYVKALFEKGTAGAFEEIEVKAGNYYRGHWIDHPARPRSTKCRNLSGPIALRHFSRRVLRLRSMRRPLP